MNKILVVIGIAIGVLSFMAGRESVLIQYKRPVSVDTPPLANLPRDQWPEHGLDAVKRGLAWGQCEVCGFPVTDKDVLRGFGKAVGFMDYGIYWETFVCYRHTNRVLSSHRTNLNRQVF